MKKLLIMIIALAFCFAGAKAQEWGTLEAILGSPNSSPKSAKSAGVVNKNDEVTLVVSSDGATKEEATKSEVVNKNDEVTLVVSSDGATKEEATKFALRSAIEQAFGTFVSANTTILNDELVKEEIATISSGNIKSYSEVASVTFPNGRTSVTINTTVCISKLVSYSKSKGSAAEFAGATFAQNMKIKELNKQNEVIALKNLYKQVKEMLPGSYDKELTIGDARVSDKKGFYELPISVKIVPTGQAKNIMSLINSTLRNLSLTMEEIEEYAKLNLDRKGVEFYIGDKDAIDEDYALAVLRDKKKSGDMLDLIYFQVLYEMFSFALRDNIGVISTCMLEEYKEAHGGGYATESRNLFFMCTHLFSNEEHILEKKKINGIEYMTVVDFWNDYNRETYKHEIWLKTSKLSGIYEYVCVYYGGQIVFPLSLNIPVEDIDKYSNFEINRLELPDMEEVNGI